MYVGLVVLLRLELYIYIYIYIVLDLPVALFLFCTIAQFDTAQCYGYYDDESPILTEDNCEIDNCFLRFTRNINYV